MPETTATPETVFRDYAPRIYAIARRMLGNDTDAEEVTSDVLLQVVRKLDTFRGDAALATWLHRVTVNAALAHREKRANRQKHEHASGDAIGEIETDHVPQPFPRMWEVTPDASALAAEQRAVIEKSIAELDPMYRDVFVLADVEGLANADVGEVLNLSVPAVKSRLHRARLMMRDRLAKHFEEGPPS
jgi:RNA polymerase sigma-70 factor, ECF subfamily